MIDCDLNVEDVLCDFDGSSLWHENVALRREMTSDGLTSWGRNVEVTAQNVFQPQLPHNFRKRLHITPVYFTLVADIDHPVRMKTSAMCEVMRALKRTWTTQEETCEASSYTDGHAVDTPSSRSECSDSEFEDTGTDSSDFVSDADEEDEEDEGDDESTAETQLIDTDEDEDDLENELGHENRVDYAQCELFHGDQAPLP